MMTLFQGSGVALVTPFTHDNQVHFEKIRELIEWHIKQGTDAIIVCGTTGEAPTLQDQEHQKIIRFAIEVVDTRLPLIAGTGSNNTAHAIMMSRYAERVGADGVMCVTPYYNKTTQRGLIANFRAIADAISIPMILYNVPSRTGVNILPPTVAALAEHPNIVAIKEASGNMAQVVEIARRVPADFAIYSGEDGIIVPILSVQGQGVISTVANIVPHDTHALVQAWFEGDAQKACEAQLRMKPLIDAVFLEVNPIPIKTAMNLLDFEVGAPRLPLTAMDEAHLNTLQQRMAEYGLFSASESC